MSSPPPPRVRIPSAALAAAPVAGARCQAVRSARDPRTVPLTLVTGPANAAKAGAVLQRFRAAPPRDPLLVVPTRADAEHYQRELAASGVVFGGEVVTFAGLARQIGERTGSRRRGLGTVASARVLRAAIEDAGLRLLAPSAGTPGFAGAVAALI